MKLEWKLLVFFLSGQFLFPNQIWAESKKMPLTVRADAWCPYNCDSKGLPGFGIEIYKESLKDKYDVDYKILPWQRALEEAKSGKISSVIGANAKDAKNFGLLIGEEPIASSSNCIFVKTTSNFLYQNPKDLDQLKRIGIIQDYTYSHDIDEWLGKAENKSKLDYVSGENPSALNAKKLSAGRLDAVIEDKFVMGYTLKETALSAGVKSAGCAKGEAIFIAFSPKLKNVKEITKKLDESIRKMRKDGKLSEIYSRYGVSE